MKLLFVIFILFGFNYIPDNYLTGKTEDVAFSSGPVKEIYEMMPAELQKLIINLENTNSGSFTFENSNYIENQAINIRFNQYNELDHVGLYLLNRDVNDRNLATVFDFLERCLLSYCLLNDNAAILERMHHDRITMFVDGVKIDRPANTPICSYFTFNSNTPFLLNQHLKILTANWSISHLHHVELRFSNDYYLIAGKGKYELEHDLLRELNNIPKGSHLQIEPAKTELMNFRDEIYLLEGSIYSQTPEINSDRYFFISDTVLPVYNENYPFESISNLFLNIVPASLKVNVKHNLYGDRIAYYNLDINDLLSYFLPEHDLFFGWQNRDQNNMKASVFIYNSFFSFSHLMVLEFTFEDIFYKGGNILGSFYSFTPQHNLKSNLGNNN